MADRDKAKDGYGVTSSRGASEGEDYGDEQGTRVGKPRERKGQGRNSRNVVKGLKGSIPDKPETRGKRSKTGAGTESEAEPVERTREHVSGYGGAGGTPKTSSDQREPSEPSGKDPRKR